jgi:hypothetical protein
LTWLSPKRAATALIGAPFLVVALCVALPLAAQAGPAESSQASPVHAAQGTPARSGIASSIKSATATTGPVVYAINPNHGPIQGGTNVAIFGSGFVGATEVKFGGATTSCGGAGFFVVSDTQIIVSAPPGSAGTVDVVVIGVGGSSATGAADKFTYQSASLAVVNGVSPNVGSTAGGTLVTLNGTGFTNATKVSFGSQSVFASVIFDTLLEVSSPPGSAGTVDLIVTNPAGNSAIASTDKFTYTTPGTPAVNAVVPNSGPATGSLGVEIAGSGFSHATAVKFGSTTLGTGQFTVIDDNHISVNVPPGTAATSVDVTITTPAGTSPATNADKFSYLAAGVPVVQGVLFNHGPAIGGTSVTLFGSGFNGVTAVNFGGNPGTAVTANNDNTLSVTSPAGAVGTVHITVVTPVGTSSTGVADQFTYVATPVPAVYGVSPSRGPTTGTTFVSIFGSGFTGVTAVHFGTNSAVINPGGPDNQINVNVPAGSVGQVDVTVTTPGGTSPTGPSAKFTYVAPGNPVVNSVTPNQGSSGGGTVVELFGSGFTGTTSVKFGAVAATAFIAFNDNQIQLTSPAGTAGTTVNITVTTPVGVSAITNADHFGYVTPVVPAITAVSPASGPTTGGTVVWISGSGLSGVSSVTFGVNAAFNFQPQSDNVIEVVATPPGAAGVVDVKVTTPGGTSPVTAADHFTYTAPPAPVVATVGPASGPSTGGTTVYIGGSGFEGATNLKFGANGAPFAVFSDVLITATSPAGAVGVTDVTVTTPGGTSATSANDQFTYTASSPPPAPSVTAVSPSSGPTAGGANVWITGTNFTGTTTVNFGLTPASFFVSDDNLITVTGTPAEAAATVNVTVVTPSGTSATTANDQYTYVAVAPTVTAVSPGVSAVGSTVYITGTGFTGLSTVAFGGTPASAGIDSNGLINASVPAGSGTVDVTVTNSGGTSATSASDQFTYGSTPTGLQVNGVTANHGPTGGGTQVEIFGLGFTGVSAVMFGSAQASSFFFSSDSLVFATSPAGTAGTVDITIKVGTTTSSINNGDRFTYAGPVTPVVNALQPNHGSSAGSTSVTIFGSGFTGPTSVQFGTSPASNVFAFNDTQMNATSPSGTAGTSVDVTVTTSAGTSATSAADLFTYVTPSAPAVDAVTPSSGSTLGGTNVNIFGSGFSGVTTVMFGTTAAFATFSSDTQININAPPGAAGAVDVTVTTPGGTSATNNADKFTYVAPTTPVVSAVSPNRGGTAGKRTVRVFGSGFSGATNVQFGTTSATTFSLIGDGDLLVSTPPGAVGTVDVTVTTPGGTSATGTPDKYTYFVAPAPTITAVSPSSGTPGSTVFLTGTGLSDVTSVLFGTTCVGSFFNFSATDTSLEVVAPFGVTGTVDVTVVSPDGTSVVNANDKFTYTAAGVPTVTAVAPASGPSGGGTSVFIAGTGLVGVTGVTFGTTPATFFFAFDDGLIQANSPPGTNGTTVDVRVTTSGGTSAMSSADHFSYGPTPAPAITVVSPNSGIDGGGDQVFVTGTGFSNASVMHFGTTTVNPCFFFRGGLAPSRLAPRPTVPTVRVPIATRLPVRTPAGTLRPGTNSTQPFTTVLVPSLPHQVLTGLAPKPAAGRPTAPLAGGPTPCASGFIALTDNLIETFTPPKGSNPATVDVTVTTAGGTSSTGAADQFTYVATPAPVVTAVSPSSGRSAGGQTVFISGSNLTNPTSVHFGTATATITFDQFFFFFGFSSSSLVEVISPAGVNPSTVDVTVTTAGGTSATSPADTYTYGPTPAPTVGAIGPNTGPDGTTVYITGTNLLGATAVKFGSATALPRRFGAQAPAAGGGQPGFFVISDNLIQAVSPVNTGSVDVTVTTVGGTSATGPADKYSYTPSPVPAVTAVGPGGGAPGTIVYINGTGFTGASAVAFGATNALGLAILSDSLIQVTSPPGVGTVDVRVTTPGGTSAITAADKYVYGPPPPAPTVTSVVPSTGPTAGGTSVTITGTNFTSAMAVSFGATAATTFIVNTVTKITATSPAGSGVVDVRVTTPGGTSAITAGDKFTYTGPPTVSSVVPIGGPTTGGTSVTITGTGFTGATAVAFGATAATTFTVNSSTKITATSPAGAAGTVDVTVTSPAGTSATSAADNFTYTTPPTVTAVAPNAGPTAGGTSVKITGTNLTAATTVKFGTVAATTFSVDSATQITATSPAHAAGAVDVTVTTLGGTSATSGADTFTYVAPPTVTSLSPNTGATTGATSVTITGTNFASVTAVQFGANAATSFIVNSTTQITAASPAGAAGTVDVTVSTTVGGTSATGAGDKFTYVPPPCATAAVNPDKSSPQVTGTLVTWTATSTGCADPIYAFYLQYPDGTWHLTRAFSPTATWAWDTSGYALGVYNIHVWANEAGSNTSMFQAVGAASFTLTAPGHCATANLSPPSTSAPAGGIVTLTASSTGCPNPLYEFWVGYPDGTWHLKQAFGPSATFNWDTSGLAPGSYSVHLWANQSGDSQSTFEAFASSAVTLTGCATAGLSPGNSSVTVGTVVMFTATSTGCPNPVYEFWVGYPNGTYVLGRAFSATATWSWDTTGLATGTYNIHVWANQQGAATNTFEANGASTITLTTAGACTSAGLSPASPSAPAGSVVALTATSSGCPNPLYEFWVGYPDGTWHLKQAFGASATFNWDTSGLAPGTYFVHVWANQSGHSQSTFEAFASSTVTLTGCATAGLSPASTSVTVGTAVAFTATSTGCPNPVYEFWVGYPNGTYVLGRAFNATATWSWDTTGLATGTYNIHVWANQQGAATNTWEANGASTVTLTTAGACATASLSPTNPSAAAGTTVALTASSTGCPNPLYEFWVGYPDGTWHLKQAFSASATFNWDTSGLAPGTYFVHVWANQSGHSQSTFEAFGSTTVTLTGCTSAALSSDVSSPKPVGTKVTFTATSIGCPTPVYEFWLQYPDGTWHKMQGFTPGVTTWQWNTTGLAPGVYHVHVWANNQGADTSTFETFGSFDFTLT